MLPVQAMSDPCCKQISLRLTQGEDTTTVQLMGDILQDDGLVLASDFFYTALQPACLKVCFLQQSFLVSGVVESCSKIGTLYLVNFKMQQQDKLQTRMLLQLSEIEQYRHALLEKGREISLDQAAEEWISQFACSFAAEFDADH